MFLLPSCKLLHYAMQNYSSDTSALETHARSGSYGRGYFNNFHLICEFITSKSVLIYMVWHCISDTRCLRKLMLHSGNHMGSWLAAIRARPYFHANLPYPREPWAPTAQIAMAQEQKYRDSVHSCYLQPPAPPGIDTHLYD